MKIDDALQEIADSDEYTVLVQQVKLLEVVAGKKGQKSKAAKKQFKRVMVRFDKVFHRVEHAFDVVRGHTQSSRRPGRDQGKHTVFGSTQHNIQKLEVTFYKKVKEILPFFWAIYIRLPNNKHLQRV